MITLSEWRCKAKAGTLTAEERHEAKEACAAIAEIARTARPRIGRLFIKAAIMGYNESRNPLYLWEAYVVADDYGLPVPEVVERYLHGCAQALTENKHSTPAALLNALHLHSKGRGTYSSRYMQRKGQLNGRELEAVDNYLRGARGYETQENATDKLGLMDARQFRRLLENLEAFAQLNLSSPDI